MKKKKRDRDRQTDRQTDRDTERANPNPFVKSILGASVPPSPHPPLPQPNLMFGPHCQAESRGVIKKLILVDYVGGLGQTRVLLPE